MTKYILILAIFTIIVACQKPNDPITDKDIDNPIDTFDCPLPLWRTSPNPVIWDFSYHHKATVSKDEKYLRYFYSSDSRMRIFNLRTGQLRLLDLNSMNHPPNLRGLTLAQYRTCPYDPDRFLARVVCTADMNGDGVYKYAQRFFIISYDGTEFTDVTPSVHYTHQGGLGSLGSIADWLPESKPGEDYFLLGNAFSSYIQIQTNPVVYSPQKDEFYEPRWDQLVTFSKDGSKTLYANKDEKALYVNDKKIILPEEIEKTFGYKLSPSGRYLVTCGWPEKNGYERMQEVWVMDLDRFLNENLDTVPVHIINLRKNFCMFGPYNLSFMSDTTLMISMLADLAPHAYLYEISISGRMIRQLTAESIK